MSEKLQVKNNAKEARRLVSGHIKEMLCIIVFLLLMGLGIGVISQIPILGFIVAALGGIYTTVFTLYAIQQKMILGSKDSMVQIVLDTYNKNKEKRGEFILIGIIEVLISLAVSIVYMIFVAGSIVSIFLLQDFSCMLMLCVSTILFLFVCYYISVYCTYYYSDCLLGVEKGTHTVSNCRGSVLKMSLTLTLLSIIPIIGWLIAVWYSFCCDTRIILDCSYSVGQSTIY